MTLDHAAAAADRDPEVLGFDVVGSHTPYLRSLYVRAFRQGAQQGEQAGFEAAVAIRARAVEEELKAEKLMTLDHAAAAHSPTCRREITRHADDSAAYLSEVCTCGLAAAQAAADREQLFPQWVHDLYVKAFRQGAQWQQSQDLRLGCTCRCCDHSEGSDCACDCHTSGCCAFTDAELGLATRVETLTNSPTLNTGSTAASIEAVRPFQSCHCPAAHGEPCPLTLDECAARTDDYVGLPWFGARLRRIWDGFVSESLNGVVCSIPDTGLNTPAHRTWCVRCQRRYMELKALVEMLDPPVTAPSDPAERAPRGTS